MKQIEAKLVQHYFQNLAKTFHRDKKQTHSPNAKEKIFTHLDEKIEARFTKSAPREN